MKLNIPVLLLTLTLLFSGCQTVGDRDTPVRVPLALATIRVINGDAERAQRVLDGADAVIAAFDEASEAIPLPYVRDEIKRVIGFDELATVDQDSIELLLVELEEYLVAYAVAGAVPPQHRDRAIEIVGYVREQAHRSLERALNQQ